MSDQPQTWTGPDLTAGSPAGWLIDHAGFAVSESTVYRC
jgi:hypothetical protein